MRESLTDSLCHVDSHQGNQISRRACSWLVGKNMQKTAACRIALEHRHANLASEGHIIPPSAQWQDRHLPPAMPATSKR